MKLATSCALKRCTAKAPVYFLLRKVILLHRLLSNDELKEAGAIIFDEFHERHLETDLSLALTLQLQNKKRPDLKDRCNVRHS